MLICFHDASPAGVILLEPVPPALRAARADGFVPCSVHGRPAGCRSLRRRDRWIERSGGAGIGQHPGLGGCRRVTNRETRAGDGQAPSGCARDGAGRLAAGTRCTSSSWARPGGDVGSSAKAVSVMPAAVARSMLDVAEFVAVTVWPVAARQQRRVAILASRVPVPKSLR